MRARLPILWLLLGCAGCAAHSGAAERVWLPTYLFGAFGGGDVDVRDLCPSGSAEQVSVGSSWSTLGVSVVTLGVYTPREAKVRCAPTR